MNTDETQPAPAVATPALGSPVLALAYEITLRAQNGAGGGAEPERREVVKLVTSSWHDKRGLHIRRDLLSVKRKSSGHQCLEEDCSMISPDEVWTRIVNLHECKDGLYEVVICNESKDWETGYVEDYDYRLVAFGGGGENTPTNGRRKFG